MATELAYEVVCETDPDATAADDEVPTVAGAEAEDCVVDAAASDSVAFPTNASLLYALVVRPSRAQTTPFITCCWKVASCHVEFR